MAHVKSVLASKRPFPPQDAAATQQLNPIQVGHPIIDAAAHTVTVAV
ncbi:MAG: hypothetical protein M5U34_43495 [Chloroflexi bacterium]|nr:hypothetical protein [Chloroflexota bacterium]